MDNGPSVIREHQNLVIDTIKNITRGDWKVLIVDETSKAIIDTTVKEDDILNQNIANIERIEDKREENPTMDAIYILSPQTHIVDCLIADLERRKYKKYYLVWTSELNGTQEGRLQGFRPLIGGFWTLPLDYFPRESHLVTFRDPWSFPMLYHPDCNDVVAEHMRSLAKKIAAICITLGEYPKVRYYKSKEPLHEASVLSWHLARFVQERLDRYEEKNRGYSESPRPRGVLLITDRSMDLMAPLVHEFTYQAMAHDLLPLREIPKVTFHMTINEGTAAAEEKDMEIVETDKVWVENRHRHMKDTIDKLMSDFNKFIAQNPSFTDQPDDGNAPSLNAIRDMLAGLPQFQQMKEAYSLHLTMAQDAMSVFQRHKVSDIASIEQTMATGLDEDFKKPKNVLDQVVRLLDDEEVTKEDRLRLICLYVLYRDGLIPEDINRLLAHSGLPSSEFGAIENLALLGAQPTRPLKGLRQTPPPLFPANTKNAAQSDEYALSRYEPAVKHMLEGVCNGTLDRVAFPSVGPSEDLNEDQVVQTSLRSAAPRWASANRRQIENRQRIIVFVAGGATYSEARACYEVSQTHNRDVFLATSHMLKPSFFLRQVKDLSTGRGRLDLPIDRPKPRPPAHLRERPAPTPAQQRPGGPPPMGAGPGGSRPPANVRPPTKALGAMTLSSSGGGGGSSMSMSTSSQVSQSSSVAGADEWPSGGGSESSRHKLTKDKDRKKRGIFGLKK